MDDVDEQASIRVVAEMVVRLAARDDVGDDDYEKRSSIDD